MSITWGEIRNKYKETNFGELEGKTLKEIKIDKDDDDVVTFITDCGKKYLMGHVQD